jgi:hypothetical protein
MKNKPWTACRLAASVVRLNRKYYTRLKRWQNTLAYFDSFSLTGKNKVLTACSLAASGVSLNRKYYTRLKRWQNTLAYFDSFSLTGKNKVLTAKSSRLFICKAIRLIVDFNDKLQQTSYLHSLSFITTICYCIKRILKYPGAATTKLFTVVSYDL